jgi:hypothetical protein
VQKKKKKKINTKETSSRQIMKKQLRLRQQKHNTNKIDKIPKIKKVKNSRTPQM